MLKTTLFNFGFLPVLLSCGLAVATAAKAADGVLVVPSDQLEDWWVSERKVAPRYPQKALGRLTEGCVAIGFIIEADGTTSAHRAISGYPSSVFNRSGIEAAKQFRFTPSAKNTQPQAVFTATSFSYSLEDSSGISKNEALSDICSEAANEALDAMIAETDAN